MTQKNQNTDKHLASPRYVTGNNYLCILLNMVQKILNNYYKHMIAVILKHVLNTENVGISFKSEVKFSNGTEIGYIKLFKQVLFYISGS